MALALASVRNARRGFIDYRTGVPILLVAATLSPLGAWVSQGLERRTLLALFVLFLLFAAVMMLRPAPRARTDRPQASGAAAFGSVVGAVAGFVGGLLGVGGGNIIAPALVAAGHGADAAPRARRTLAGKWDLRSLPRGRDGSRGVCTPITK